MRDYANTHQLIVLANLESLNAELIKANQTKEYRLKRLREIAISQLKSLSKTKSIEHLLAESPNKPTVEPSPDSNQKIKESLDDIPPKEDDE